MNDQLPVVVGLRPGGPVATEIGIDIVLQDWPTLGWFRAPGAIIGDCDIAAGRHARLRCS
jgi:hypothetical protein